VPSGLHQAWPSIDATDREAVLEVLDSGVLAGSNGPQASALEREWAERLGVRHCLSLSSGTAALHCAAVATGLAPGDEVIVPAVSFVASAFAFAHHGLVPVFCDIDPRTFNLDVGRVEGLIGERTRAIAPVHLHGLPCDMDEIGALARRHGLVVIEDAAQAHGALYRGREVGTLGDAAAFSLNASKNLCAGEGGLFVTDDGDAWEAARRLSNLGEVSPPRKPEQFRSYWAQGLGWHYRLPELGAAVARSQLRKLDDVIRRGQRTAKVLTEGLSRVRGVVPPLTPPDRTHVWHKYRIRIDTDALGFTGPVTELRDRLLFALKAEGVEAVVWQLYPLPALPAFRRNGLRPWTPRSRGDGLEAWRRERFPNASQVLDDSLVLGSERYPIFNQDVELAERYVDACEHVFAHLDEVLARPHKGLELTEGPIVP
jgi:dTDP-4-amino-4,6-dideoxygalactose transaminase